MADLDDFFARKDRAKQKAKSKARQAAEKVDDPAAEAEARKAAPREDDEWKDFEEKKAPDYTGLRIASMSVSEAPAAEAEAAPEPATPAAEEPASEEEPSPSPAPAPAQAVKAPYRPGAFATGGRPRETGPDLSSMQFPTLQQAAQDAKQSSKKDLKDFQTATKAAPRRADGGASSTYRPPALRDNVYSALRSQRD
eukprot:m.223066 g.223066  ORF g.223066 m.223066 type:complete len:196 (+) comp10868_c0_seq1:1314-1901(+)